MKKPIAIVSHGYWFRIAVPVEKLSEVITLLSSAQQVDSAWHNNTNVWYRKEHDTNITVEIVNEVLDAKPEEPVAEEKQAA